ncbi:MAG: GntR family transcriptional regulator [Anaerolineaceae bacterium]|nr:MAG: GntR family transcriptional regulator [Anaerolineaceae bacterium]
MASMAEKELTHKPLKEEIYDALHRHIIAGKYGPGDWLRQDDIASQMGVSMTPVREALDLLVSTGLAERVPYRGVRVREMSTKDIVEAYGLRLILEAIIAREAAMNITSEQASGLKKILDEMNRHVKLNEMPLERQLSREFHTAIAEASGNDLLVKLYAVVANAFPDWLLYEALFRNPELLTGSVSQTHDEHTAILDALAKGDADKAVQASIEHVMDSGKWLQEYLNIPEKMLREKEKQVTHLIRR